MYTAQIEQIRLNDTRFSYPRVLLLNIKSDGILLRDHMWVQASKAMLRQKPHTLIEFTAKEKPPST